MIFLTRINNEQFVLNCDFIQEIETVPESKVTLINHEVYIVKENPQEIIEKTIEYRTRAGGQVKVVESWEPID